MRQARAGENESVRELKLSHGGCEACLPVQLSTSLGHGGHGACSSVGACVDGKEMGTRPSQAHESEEKGAGWSREMAYSCHSWESLWLAMLPRAWTPPGCDPGMAWSSYHTGKDLLSGLEVPH